MLSIEGHMYTTIECCIIFFISCLRREEKHTCNDNSDVQLSLNNRIYLQSFAYI